MNTRDLEAFVAVVESGSVVAASSRLNLTQPGVTRRIQSLEQLLDIQLLERLSKPLRPTEAGRRVYELSRKVLRSIEDLRASVVQSNALTGELRLGISQFVAETALAGPLDDLRTAFPLLTVQATSAWSPELVEQVRRNQLDAAVVYLPQDEKLPSGLHSELVGEQEVAVVAPLDSPLPDQVRLKHLRDMPWVLNQEGCGVRRMIRRALERAGLPFEISVEARSEDLQLSLISRNVGLGIVPLRIAVASPWRDLVRVIDVPELKKAIGISVVHQSPDGWLSLPIRHFRDSLLTAYAITSHR